LSKQNPPPGYIFQRLNVIVHSREAFNSDDKDINDFIKTKANQFQGKFESATHVLCESLSTQPPHPICGYITMLPANAPLSVPIPSRQKKAGENSVVRAMLLARMGVDTKHKGKLLGEFLIKAAFEMTAKAHDIFSCPLLIVDPKIAAMELYPKYGFTPFQGKPERMFITTEEIIKRLESGNIRNA
jgi:hypothetical protein